MQLFKPGFSYLIDMRVPVLVVLGLGLCAVDPGEKGGFGEVHQSRVQTKRLGYNVLDSPANLPDEDEQTTHVTHRLIAQQIVEEMMINSRLRWTKRTESGLVKTPHKEFVLKCFFFSYFLGTQ